MRRLLAQSLALIVATKASRIQIRRPDDIGQATHLQHGRHVPDYRGALVSKTARYPGNAIAALVALVRFALPNQNSAGAWSVPPLSHIRGRDCDLQKPQLKTRLHAADGAGVAHHASRARVHCQYGDSVKNQDLSVAELKKELLDLLAAQPDRGITSTTEDREDILEIADELEPLNPNPDWANGPTLFNEWRMVYTSSEKFHVRGNLLCFGNVAGGSTPELYMRLRTGRLGKIVEFEEPIEWPDSPAGGFIQMWGNLLSAGGIDQPDAMNCEGFWVETEAGACKMEMRVMKAGNRNWLPNIQQNKAMNVISYSTPIFLDESLLIFRCSLPQVLFIFVRRK